jgi:diguanylate cyclase (GGDEF)-like protein
MNVFFIGSVAGAIVICLSLTALIKLFLNPSPFASAIIYVLTICVSFCWFYFTYLKTVRFYSKKEADNVLTLNKLNGEKHILKQKLNIMENLISTDSLTGLWNKSYCFSRLEQELRRTKRNKGTFSVLMIDIDNFKTINDTYGHLQGDDYLTAFAELLKKSVRISDIISRYGGDEFVTILPDTTTEGAQKVAEKLMKKAQTIKFFSEHEFTISIGICSRCETFKDYAEIIKCADYALYKGKRGGKNRSVCYEKQDYLVQESVQG